MTHHAISGYENSGMSLAVDATGLGKPVVHLLNQEGLFPMSIIITGGDGVVRADLRNWKVPKRDLVSTLLVLFQTNQLKISDGLELATRFCQGAVESHGQDRSQDIS